MANDGTSVDACDGAWDVDRCNAVVKADDRKSVEADDGA